MEKRLALLKRAPGVTREAFFDAVNEQTRLSARDEAVAGLVVNLVDVPPEEAGLRPGGEPAFDAVIETWCQPNADPSSSGMAVGGQCQIYRVAEFTHKQYQRDWPDGQRSPGVKSFYLAGRHPSMTHEEMARYWGEQHAPLALRIHIGMWRYTRNVVSAALTPGAPDWDGMAILHFRTAEDLRERFYDSEAGRRAIAEDVAKFSGAGKALHTSEWILKAPPAD
jgi:uncharacterized protein (TIGR02118 family)